MDTKTLFTTALVLLAVSANAATAEDKKSTEGQTQYRIKNQAAVANINTKAAARIDLPAAASGLSGINVIKPHIGLPPTAADRLGNVGAAAAAAEQARGLREAQQAVKEMANLKGIKNLGDINHLNKLIGRHDSNNPLDSLGNRPRGHGRPDYIKDNPYGPSNTHNDGSGKYTGGGLMPLSPRDSVGPRGIGLVSQGNGPHRDHHGDRITYTKVRRKSDGSTRQDSYTYREDTGELTGAYSRNVDAQGNTTSSRQVTVIGLDFTDGSPRPIVREITTDEHSNTSFEERTLGTEATDPPATDPYAGIPTDDPYATGGRPMPCGPPTPDYVCAREAQAQADSRVQPTLVNPGDADLAQTQLAPQLAIDTQGLVTNPPPGGYAGGGFNPPPGWQPGENGTPGANPGPGGMPPRPGSKP